MSVDEYIRSAATERQAALKRIRSICRAVLTGYEEVIEYGMPGYRKNGTLEISFASQKNNIALYILKKPVMDRHRDKFSRSNVGKGCIRYPNPEKIDFELIEQMVRESFESDDRIC